MFKLNICLMIIVQTLVMPDVLRAQSEQSLYSNQVFKPTGFWAGARTQYMYQFGSRPSYLGFHIQSEFNRQYLIGLNFQEYHQYAPTNTVSFYVNMRWLGLHLGYRLKPNYVVHPMFEAEIGIGDVYVENAGGGNVGVLASTAGVEINVTRWLHLTFSGGYRWITPVDIEPYRSSQLMNAYTQIGVRIGTSRDKKRLVTPD